MRNLIAVICIFFSSASNSGEINFSYNNKAFSFNNNNKYCFPKEGSSTKKVFEKLADGAVAAGEEANIVHMKYCTEPFVTPGLNKIIPTMWIRPQGGDLPESPDGVLEKALIQIYKAQLPEVNSNHGKQRIEKLGDIINRPIDNQVEIEKVEVLQDSPFVIKMGIINTANAEKIATISLGTIRVVDNEAFFVYVGVPVGDYGFTKGLYSYLTDLSFIANSIKSKTSLTAKPKARPDKITSLSNVESDTNSNSNVDYEPRINGLLLRASNGDHEAQYLLGNWFLRNQSNKEKSFEWLLKSALGNYRLAMRLVGLRYYTGNGVVKDLNRASVWLGLYVQNTQTLLGQGLIEAIDQELEKKNLKMAQAFVDKISTNKSDEEFLELFVISSKCAASAALEKKITCEYLNTDSLGGNSSKDNSVIEPNKYAASSGLGDVLLKQIEPCWNVDKNNKYTSVTVSFSLDKTGRVINNEIKLVSSEGTDGAAGRRSFLNAKKTIFKCQKKWDGFNLEASSYDEWRDIVMTFKPDMIRK